MFDRQGQRKYLNGAERQAYLEMLLRERDEERRAFGLTLFYTGCRISEALNLTAARVDLSQRCLVFETLKRRKHGVFRGVPIPDNLIRILAVLAESMEPCDKIWSFSRATAYRYVKSLMMHSNITGPMGSPKGLRHGFAIAAIGRNIPLPAVQKWLGHARLETTAIYLNVSGDEERQLAKRIWSESESLE